MNPQQNRIEYFWVIGINYKSADTVVRSEFSIHQHEYAQLLAEKHKINVSELWALSTCNRTEIYVRTHDINDLIDYFCELKQQPLAKFEQHAYVLNGEVAIQHLFRVAAGIDAQILGDYEIVHQIKTAFLYAKMNGGVGAFMERLFNTVLQATRHIRSATNLSSGTVSMAYAACQLILQRYTQIEQLKIAVLGLGVIGQNFCKNLWTSVSPHQVVVLNRNIEKAIHFSEEWNCQYADWNQLIEHVNAVDVVVVATNALLPIVNAEMLAQNRSQLLIDLSIPNNIDADVRDSGLHTLVTVDDLGKIHDDTLAARQAELPKALAIIAEQKQQFLEWTELQQSIPLIKVMKSKLGELNNQLFEENSEAVLQKTINTMALKIKNKNSFQPGCHYIETLHEFLQQKVTNS